MKSTQLRIFLFYFFIACTSIAHGQNKKLLSEKKFAKDFTTNDTLFKAPYIDINEWRDVPVHHRYVHGGFKGTETRFSFYFPPKEQYQGRFYQYITPIPDNEYLSQGATGEEDKICFSIASGAYFIETNGGGKIDFAKPRINNDPTMGAYRANAASAQFSRVVAMEIYRGKRPFGYAFGGSGGAYRTIGGIESTEDVWDGAVPYVVGSPMAIPNVFTVRMYAMQLLKDKFPQIIDAVEPGGSGDMYTGLNEEEKSALQEVTRMGFPPKSWYGYNDMGIHGFLVLYQGVVSADRKYFTDDFWNVPGYLGANPPASLLKARIQKVSKIKMGINVDQTIKMGLIEPMSPQERGTADLAWKSTGGEPGAMPVAFQLEDMLPGVYFLGGDLMIKSGDAIYPQRPLLIGPLFTRAAAGVLPTGKFKGKMIVLASLWDREAFPWQADWYRDRVKENLGENTDNNFRLWYTDHALHGDLSRQEDPTRTISYLGVLQQALRDLSDWVEKGVEPPVTTNYKIEDGQVLVPPTAAERKGIQPVVDLKVKGSKRADIVSGEKVTFTAQIQVPQNTGKIVSAEWDFEGAGTFPVAGKFIPTDKTGSLGTIETTYTFSKPGTFFPILRVASQRQGDEKTPFTRIQNLDRVRVVVK